MGRDGDTGGCTGLGGARGKWTTSPAGGGLGRRTREVVGTGGRGVWSIRRKKRD